MAIIPLAGCGTWVSQPIGSVNVDETIIAVNGHCHDAARVVVDESASEVALTLEVKGDSRGDCLGCEVVVLSDPVGDREVVDGTSGEVIPVNEVCEFGGPPPR